MKRFDSDGDEVMHSPQKESADSPDRLDELEERLAMGELRKGESRSLPIRPHVLTNASDIRAHIAREPTSLLKAIKSGDYVGLVQLVTFKNVLKYFTKVNECPMFLFE